VTTGRDIIQQLLQRAATTAASPPDGDDGTSDYDWTRPHSVPEALLQDVSDLLGRSGDELAAALGRIVRGDVAIEVSELKEIYASDLAPEAAEQMYYVALNTSDDKPCGFLAAPGASAIEWVAILLGGSGGGADREMSALEQSLLGDVMASLAGAIVGPIAAAGGGEIVPAHDVTREIPAVGEGSCEYLAMNFIRPDLKGRVAATAAIRCDVISPAVGGGAGAVNRSPAENRRAMLAQLSRVSVDVVGQLGKTEISIRDASTLGVGDVLVLDLAVGQEVEVYVQQTRIAMGMPVRDGEKKAVQITEMIAANATGADGASSGQ